MTRGGAERGGVEDMRYVESKSARCRFTVGGLLPALLLACALGTPGQAVGSAQPAAAATPAPATLRQVTAHEGAPGTELVMRADSEVVWTSYRDADGSLVIELPNTVPAEGLAPTPAEGLLASVAIEREASGDRPLTRLTVRGSESFEYSLASEDNALKLRMLPSTPGAPVAATRVAPPAPMPASEPAPILAQPQGADEPSAAPVATANLDAAVLEVDRVYEAPAPSGSIGSRLDAVESLGVDSFRLRGDGEFAYSYRRLSGPERFVLDLQGVFDQAARPAALASGGVVQRVRMAQFRPAPDPVTRVVFDLASASTPEIVRSADGLVVRFGAAAGASRPTAVAAADTPAAAPAPPVAASAPAPRQAAAAMPAPAPPARVAIAPPMAPSAVAAVATVSTAVPNNEVAVRNLSTTVGGQQKVYSGEPISLSIRDGDIREVLRAIAELSNLNMVIQPGINASVTVELKSVPWDQALDQILRINNLGMELEGNILRIAPVAQLRAEAEETQRLKAAQALSVPLKTVIKRLSYATAQDIAVILQRQGGIGVGGNLMSQRGSVIVDQRTSTLIIKELPEYIDTVLAVIDNLDTPEPQVMIEARIVETTKQFSRSIGIAWNFDGIADAAHGNTTGLVFPNNVSSQGGTNLLTGGRNGFLGITLGNVLNTFTLDAQLQAAENEGLINILSTPKIATLNNQSAEIQSGLQIPVQTVANNTVSVQFVNATLRLLVTPHVTAEGTVMMDINVQKREPLQAFLVVGAGNAPISTKEARTRVIVRDGGTTVIGGIYRVTQDRGQDRVPGLANIPILGHLFKNRRTNDQNEELLIFVTPRVIKL
jgi:type IV pilus secretin PilQ/predicted competence protein